MTVREFLIGPQPVKAYWWNETPNFGDALAPHLLKHFADIDSVQWSKVGHARIVSVGSILEHIPPLWDGVILGSGRLIETSRLHIVQMKSGLTPKILALRGPLTAKGIPGTYALGDPGLLADELVGPQEKKWDLGVVPHFSDKLLGPKFTSLIPKQYSVKIIHPGGDPLQVVRDIGSCHRIVASSLHGIIVADAFGIPRRIEYTHNMDHDGGNFKFRDYSASINTPFELGKMMTPSRTNVEDAKYSIYDAYRELESLKK